MRNFTLTQKMLTWRGQFYPTGHIVAMFASEQAARDAAEALVRAGATDDSLQWISPQSFGAQMADGTDQKDSPLPSPGSEADTARRLENLAATGHYGLLIEVPPREHEEAVMAALHAHHPVYAQKYARMVIEDIVE